MGAGNLQWPETYAAQYGPQREDWLTSSVLVADAKLQALANNGGPTPTMALLSGSPAINAGTATNAPATDQRGYARAGTPDIGAFEFGGAGPSAADTQSPTIPTNLAATSKTATSVNLTWAAAQDNVAVTGYDVYSGSTKVNSATEPGTAYLVTGLSANTAYSFTVRARDAAGNVSGASAVLSVTTTAATPDPASGTGLAAVYYNALDLSGAVALSRTDANVNFDWAGGSPGTGVNADNFSARWSGQVLAPVTGTYTFTTSSDDGVRLWVNGQPLINNWTDHGPTNDSGTLTLTAGQKYEIKLEYYERGGGATMRLQWAYAGQAQQAIPQSQLFPAVSVPIATAGGPAGYTRCSGEGETCVLTGTMDVAYGANGAFIYLTNRTGSVACNNGTFTDPITGVVKSCYVKASGAATTALAPVGAGLSLSAYPNPSLDGQATLTWMAQQAQRVTLRVFNQQGNLVGLFTRLVPAGESTFKLPITLAADTYYLKATVDNQPRNFILQVK